MGLRAKKRLLAVVLLLVALCSTPALALQTDDYITKADYLGKTPVQILKMGYRAWSHYVYNCPDLSHNSTVGGVDGDAIVFSFCQADRNERLLRKLGTEKQGRLKKIDELLWDFCLSSIELESTESGGGTWVIHTPHYAAIEFESVMYEVLTKTKHRPNHLSRKIEQIRHELAIRVDSTRPIRPPVLREIDPKDVRESARAGKKIFESLLKEIAPLPLQSRLAIIDLAWDYGAQYLYVRDEKPKYGTPKGD